MRFVVMYRVTRHSLASVIRTVMGQKDCTHIPGSTVHQNAIFCDVGSWESLVEAIRLYGAQDEQSHDRDPLGILKDCRWDTNYGWKPGEYRHRLEIQQFSRTD